MLPRSSDFMTREAREVLPQVLEAAGIREPILVGHSDGGTIALLAAAAGEVPLRGGRDLGRPCVQRAALHRGDRGRAGGVPRRQAPPGARPAPRRADRRRVSGLVRRLARSGIRALEHRGRAGRDPRAPAGGPGPRRPLRHPASGRGDRAPDGRPLRNPRAGRPAAIPRIGTGCGRRPRRSSASPPASNDHRCGPCTPSVSTRWVHFCGCASSGEGGATAATSFTSASGSGSGRPSVGEGSWCTRCRSARSRPPSRSSASCWSGAAGRSS